MSAAPLDVEAADIRNFGWRQWEEASKIPQAYKRAEIRYRIANQTLER